LTTISPADEPRFTELVSGYLDASRSREQEAQLLEFLREPRCQERFLELLRLESEIASLLAAPVADDMMAALVLQNIGEGLAGEEAFPATAGPLVPPRLVFPSPSRRLAFPRWVWWLGGVAAAVLLVAVFFWRQRSGFALPPLAARLTQTRERAFVFGADGYWRPAQSGQEVRVGEGIVTVGDGSGASIQYADGSRLEMGPNTLLTQVVEPAQRGRRGEEPDKRVVLMEGVLEFRAVEQPPGHPMIVRTPHAEVVVRGTRFTLESETDATALRVRQGAAQFARRDRPRSIEVEAGYSPVAEPGAEQFVARLVPDPPGAVEATLARGIRLGHKGGWSALAFAPDSSAVAGGMLEGSEVRLWQLDGGQPKGLVEFAGFTGALWSVAISPDGRLLAASGVDKAVRLWDVRTRRVLATLPHNDHLRAVAFSPDGRTLASGCFDGTVRLWQPETGAERAVFPEDDRGGWAGVYSLAFSPDGRRLAVGLSDRRVRLHSLPSGRTLVTREGHTGFVLSMAYSPRGDLLATASENEVIVREAATLAERYRLAASAPVAFSPDGGLLATGNVTPALRDTATGRKRASFRGHRKIYALTFSPDGKWLALGDWLNVTLFRNTDIAGVFWAGPPAPLRQ
jgi:hypothetical protein